MPFDNTGSLREGKGKQPKTAATTFWNWRGWRDARDGLPFCAEYDALPEHQQRNYEMGRCAAVVCAGFTGGRAPTWPRNWSLNAVARRVDADGVAAMIEEREHHLAAARKS